MSGRSSTTAEREPANVCVSQLNEGGVEWPKAK
jgi:hypothetical protein